MLAAMPICLVPMGVTTMSTTSWRLIVITVLLAFAPGVPAVEERPADFKLQDFRGAWHSLDQVRASKLVVVAFVRVECPLANLYASRLAELARSYEKKGVAFFGVDSSPEDSPSAMARFAKEQDLPFPLLKDVGNELADRLGVERTPEAFVFDSDRIVRYRGRVDDQFGFGIQRLPAKRRRKAHHRRVGRRRRSRGRSARPARAGALCSRLADSGTRPGDLPAGHR
jgi:peroxiredoxin